MEKETFDNVNAQIAMLKLAKCMILTGHDKQLVKNSHILGNYAHALIMAKKKLLMKL